MIETRTPPVGSLTDRVQLFRREMDAQDEGGYGVTYMPLAFAWSRVRMVAARQGEAFDGRAVTISHSAVMRFRNDLKAGDRIVHRGRKLEVVSAEDMNGRRAYLRCTCTEAQVTG